MPDRSHPRDLAREVIEWLRDLEPAAVVRWGEDADQIAVGWLHCWIDVGVDDPGAPDCSWLWTISEPDHEKAEQATSLPLYPYVDPDGTYWRVEVNSETAASHLVEGEGDLEADVRSALEAIAAESGGQLVSTPAWRVATISQVLADWTAVHAGRSDVTFVFDSEVRTPMYQEVMRIYEDGESDAVPWSEAFGEDLPEPPLLD